MSYSDRYSYEILQWQGYGVNPATGGGDSPARGGGDRWPQVGATTRPLTIKAEVVLLFSVNNV